jgi:phosphocarrier protein
LIAGRGLVTTLSAEYQIVNRLGLHARAAAQLVQTANRFISDVIIEKDGNQVNGKSIMGLLMLAAPQGSKISITITGDDAEEALKQIGSLINHGFGED